MLIWDLSFGRDLRDKKIFILNPSSGSFAFDIKKRYLTIWEESECKGAWPDIDPPLEYGLV